MSSKNRYLRQFDWSILLVLVGLAFFSYLGISGANPRFEEDTKQLMWYGVGFIVMFVILWFDYRILSVFSYLLYGIGIVLLIAVLFYSDQSNNVNSWFAIGSIKIQPAEFMKLFLILTVARWFAKSKEKEIEFHAFYQLWPIFLLFGIPFLLIVIQPDLGNAVVFIGIFICMLLAVGVRFRHFLYLGLIGTAGVASLAYFYFFKKEEIFDKIIKPYQWRRITSFLNPELDPSDTGYQLKQSLLAIGSGTLNGSPNAATLASNNWIPAGETDFIFAVIAERVGFLGASILILLFFLLIYRMIRIAMTTEDLFGSYLIAGVIGMFVFQIFENIGMTIGMMPITGITLPFISYGGSSLVTNMAAVGLVLNIGMRRKKLSF